VGDRRESDPLPRRVRRVHGPGEPPLRHGAHAQLGQGEAERPVFVPDAAGDGLHQARRACRHLQDARPAQNGARVQ